MKNITLSRRSRTIITLIIAAGVAAIGALLLIRDTGPANKPLQRSIVTYSTDTPDEEKPDENFKWEGLATDPKFIDLPTISNSGYIQNVGIDQKKAVAVPNNIHMAGWFVDTVLPGERGLSVIDGHVNGRKNDGVFRNLVKLKKDDQFSIEFGNGTKKTFAVQKVSSIKVDQAASVLFSQEPTITNQVNLITCGGTFNRNTNQYEERVIVIAKVL